MTLYLLRHGQTDWNLDWRLQGQTDIPLNSKGLQQAKDAAKRYKNFPFDLILSSPLNRALTTAKIIAEPHNLDVKIDDRLKEMSFGKLEGTTPEDGKNIPNRQLYFDAPEKYEPDETAESFDDVDKRVKLLLDDLKKLEGKYNHILLSSHGALCKAILRAVENKPLSKFWETPPQENCSIIEIKI